MVQVTPFRGSRLTDLIATGEQFRQGRQRLAQAERSLEQRMRQMDISESRNLIAQNKQKVEGLVFAAQSAGGDKAGTLALLAQLPGALTAEEMQDLEQLPEAVFQTMAQAAQPDVPANIQLRDRLLSDRGSVDPAVSRSADIALGLSPRSVANAETSVLAGNVPGVTMADVTESRRQTRAGTEAGAAQIEIAQDSLKELAQIRKSLQNLKEAQELLRQGAGTGAILSRLPSIQAASVALDNVQAQLGLDVVGATTFGALSESELEFALRAALPTGLEGPALLDWLERKDTAQTKLMEELQGAATFLSNPQNSLQEYIQFMTQNNALTFGAPSAGPTRAELEAEARRRGLIQ